MTQRSKQTGKFLLLIFSIVFANVGASAQSDYPNKVIENGKLKWEDFSGPVDPTSKHAAVTYWLVNYKYKILSYRGDTAHVDLQVSTFLKGNSWVLPDQKTDRLLEHEQGHFNVALICALRFKKAIASTVILKSNHAEKINSIFKALISEANQMDLQYDEETRHSLDKVAQMKWNLKLNALLLNP